MYQAFDTRLQRHVALKRLTDSSGARDALIYKTRLPRGDPPRFHPASQRRGGVRFRFRRRRSVPGSGIDRGETLQTVVGRGAFPLAEFSWLAQQTLEGLAATHGAGLLHHDLQPGNLMLKYGPSMELQVKILDFGLADFSMYTDPTPASVITGSVVGTVAYMSPNISSICPRDCAENCIQRAAFFILR